MKASVLSSPIAKEVKVSSCILSDRDKCQLEREPVADSTSRGQNALQVPSSREIIGKSSEKKAKYKLLIRKSLF